LQHNKNFSDLIVGLLLSHYFGKQYPPPPKYEGWNFNSGNYLFTTDTR